ncbi:Uncharacterized protein Rs2_09279 [Raphanus sativus]|nr:Uncharacterized protein Rs2_09279 [Raphanus sativus]
MSRRLSSAEKGKGLQRPNSPPRLGRVKLPDYDTSELRRKHELTLIGRATNPSAQRMWSLIPFFADHWKCKSRPFGADLGQGKFQFQFENLEDLQSVLDNGPYHFAKWMIIIQRWEPSLSPDFPSQIPFWIQVQGVPVHLWDEAVLRGIGADIGTFDTWEITPSKARFRAYINGLRPLVFKSTLEYGNGDEVVASLLYEKLEKHSKICCRLDHEKDDCPLNKDKQNTKHETNLQRQAQRKEISLSSTRTSTAKQLARDSAPYQPSGFMRDARRSDYARHPPPVREHSNVTRSSNDSGRSHHTPSRARYEVSRSHSSFPRQRYEQNHVESRWVDTCRRLNPAQSHHKDINPYGSFIEDRRNSLDKRGYSSNHDEIIGERPDTSSFRSPVPTAQPTLTLNEARDEIREVMLQYTRCADPSESAARKERMRLAEERGEPEENARIMVAANAINAALLNAESLNANASNMVENHNVSPPISPARLPALARLGPIATPPTDAINQSQERIPVKKRLGRPPLSKNKPKPLAAKTGAGSGIKKRRTPIRTSPKRRSPTTSSSRGGVARRAAP